MRERQSTDLRPPVPAGRDALGIIRGIRRGRLCRDESGCPAAGSELGARGAESLGLKIGDDVVHDVFGEGVILDIEGSGDHAEAIIRFRDVGEKRLLLTWAPLKRLG